MNVKCLQNVAHIVSVSISLSMQLSSSVDNLNLEGNAMGYEGLRHVTFMLQENCFITHLVGKLCWESDPFF